MGPGQPRRVTHSYVVEFFAQFPPPVVIGWLETEISLETRLGILLRGFPIGRGIEVLLNPTIGEGAW